LQPGETATFAHFLVQPYDQARTRQTVERLAALPADALADLDDLEIAAIRNFDAVTAAAVRRP
jgi:hypothetical protein